MTHHGMQNGGVRANERPSSAGQRQDAMKRQLSRGASLDTDVLIAPNKDGFIPPWDGWDFNEWEQCADADVMRPPRVSMSG